MQGWSLNYNGGICSIATIMSPMETARVCTRGKQLTYTRPRVHVMMRVVLEGLILRVPPGGSRQWWLALGFFPLAIRVVKVMLA